jgi:hypothetical protein
MVPMAWRNKESTMTMRVNAVIISNAAGKKVNAVSSSSKWVGCQDLAAGENIIE